jgi:hypothetical protein
MTLWLQTLNPREEIRQWRVSDCVLIFPAVVFGFEVRGEPLGADPAVAQQVARRFPMVGSIRQLARDPFGWRVFSCRREGIG